MIRLPALKKKFDDLLDLDEYMQEHYDKYSKEDLCYIISEICVQVTDQQLW